MVLRNRLDRKAFTLLALAITLALGTARLRLALETEAKALGRIRDPTWLPDGRILRAASCGQRLLLADLYWLKTVQYMGEAVLDKQLGWAALYPLTDLVTDLDPRYGYVYQIAGSNLAGLAGRHAEADRILDKGMRNVPDRWGIPWVHAVNKFLFQGDFKTAAALARRAAEVGHRPTLALLAANLALVTNERQEYRLADAVLREAIAQADDPALRSELEQRLVRVHTYEVLSGLEAVIERHRSRFGLPPFSLDLLAATGELRALPSDPSGGVFLYDSGTGRVSSSVLGARAPLRVTQ